MPFVFAAGEPAGAGVSRVTVAVQVVPAGSVPHEKFELTGAPRAKFAPCAGVVILITP